VAWAGPLVYFWCRKAELGKEDREDVFQEVFLKVHRGLPDFQHGESGQTFRGWLLVITRNTIIDLARRRTQEPAAAGGIVDYEALLKMTGQRLSDSESSQPSLRRQELARAVGLIREEFSESAWTAFWMTAVEGLSASDAGAELGMSPGAVRKAKSRILLRLREEFRGLID
jgi:RNA polymerase sigma-70 factor (ECF subfamily)